MAVGGKFQERELKFPVEGLESVRERLAELEAERLGPTAFEDNWVFDRDGELLERGCVLRVRSDGHGARVTYKGPRSFDGNTKVRTEIEIGVDRLEATQALLQALGYTVERRYQKKREEWRLGGVLVALDHTPIGDYIEFEGDKAETVAKRCGFDGSKAEPRSYLQLYADWLRDHPDGPPEMVFATDSGP
jgi:predicted adenylyl cyclase CyaB